MRKFTRKIDQPLLIGRSATVTLTDIDPDQVRLIVRGQLIGGPRDGERVASVHELTRQHSVHLGLNVVVTLLRIDGDEAQLGVLAPPNMPITLPSERAPDPKTPPSASEFDD